ncbi:MAG: hypothetical protein ABIK73_06030 [candidate division WOR-3 bacterium]
MKVQVTLNHRKFYIDGDIGCLFDAFNVEGKYIALHNKNSKIRKIHIRYSAVVGRTVITITKEQEQLRLEGYAEMYFESKKSKYYDLRLLMTFNSFDEMKDLANKEIAKL